MKTLVDVEKGEIHNMDPEFARCPHAAYAQVREQCPVGRSSFNGAVILARYEDVAWALRQPELFSSKMDFKVLLGNERPMIPQQVDPPEQTRYRRLLDPHFSRKKMEKLAPQIRDHANQLIDGFIDDGGCEFDAAFAIPLPCTAFLALFGLPASELQSFLEMKDGIIRPQNLVPEGGDTSFEAMTEARRATGRRIYAYFQDEIETRRRRPGDGLLEQLLVAEIEGEKLDENEILDICFLLLLAGLDTVTATLGCNIAYLAANPEERRLLAQDTPVVPGAVEELLRWETPVTSVPRIATQDVAVGDVTIREGELVSLMLGAANTDGAHFSEADTVDFGRERNLHLAFGGGPHRCLGSHLARMELRVAMEEWHRRLPDYEVAPGKTPRYSPGIREVMYLPLVWNR
ncbi:MAG: cytochrome P450 [Myxococcota bacterium]